jgi:hypothetical protein
MDIPQKTKNKTLYDTIYPKGMKSLYQKDNSTPMFIAALFTIGTLWSHPRCSLVDEQIKKTRYILHRATLLSHKKECNCNLRDMNGIVDQYVK